VLYSFSDPLNRPDRLGDDYVIVHNLNALNPIPFGLVRRGREYHASQIDESLLLLTLHDDWREGQDNIVDITTS
jgi:hypothetical protein